MGCPVIIIVPIVADKASREGYFVHSKKITSFGGRQIISTMTEHSCAELGEAYTFLTLLQIFNINTLTYSLLLSKKKILFIIITGMLFFYVASMSVDNVDNDIS
jgi:hypothetical protein